MSWRNGVFSPRSPATQSFSSRWPTPRLFKWCATIASGWPPVWTTERMILVSKMKLLSGHLFLPMLDIEYLRWNWLLGSPSLVIDSPPRRASLPRPLKYNWCRILFSELAIFPAVVRKTCDFLVVFNSDRSMNVAVWRLTCSENSSRLGGGGYLKVLIVWIDTFDVLFDVSSLTKTHKTI